MLFFQTLDIEFEYEPEGFQLQNGTLYLPDFYLPQIRMWGEVKPMYLSQREETKCSLLASGTGFNCLWLIGPPDFKSYYAATWDFGAYTIVDYSLDIDWHNRIYYSKEHRLFLQPNYPPKLDLTLFSQKYAEAVYAARTARFEDAA